MVISKKPVTPEEEQAQHQVYNAAAFFCGTVNQQHLEGNIPPSIVDEFKRAFRIIEETGMKWQKDIKERRIFTL